MAHTSVDGGAERRVGKIVCVGRNYAAHAAEMNAPRPKQPILFLKPSTALAGEGASIRIPEWSVEVHHEVELVVRVARGGRDLSAQDAKEVLDAVGVGLDLTARDVQARAKKSGHPWAVAKGWDGSAPLGKLVPLKDVERLGNLAIELRVGDEVRQSGNTRDMLWSVPELISYISSRMTLEPGDLVFTGTPEGVGPVSSGDDLRCRLGDTAQLSVSIQ